MSSTSLSTNESPEKEIPLKNGVRQQQQQDKKPVTFYCREETPDSDDSLVRLNGNGNGAHGGACACSSIRQEMKKELAGESGVNGGGAAKYNLNSLPKYIFETDHQQLKSVDSILKKIQTETIEDCGEVSEYPIEFYENQQHQIERHMSISNNAAAAAAAVANNNIKKSRIRTESTNSVERFCISFDVLNNNAALVLSNDDEYITTTTTTNKTKHDNQKQNYQTQTSTHNESHTIPFNRITINDDPQGAEIEDLVHCAELLVKSMIIREKYMVLSQQAFPYTTAKYLNKVFVDDTNRRSSIFTTNLQDTQFFEKADDEQTFNNHFMNDYDAKNRQRPNNNDKPYHPPAHVGDPFDIEFLPSLNCKFDNVKGVIHIFDENQNKPPFDEIVYPDLNMFVDDYHLMVNLISNGPLKTFCYKRLRYLKSRFELHTMLNELKELSQQKTVPHRDFYNVRKVDTHIHAASCMNQKHLLRFIKKKLKTNGDTIVVNDKVKGPLKLSEVFQELNLTPFDLSVDKLAMHAHRHTFHRFDKFNAKYNPIGQPVLRDIFIKVDNEIEGVFFAELLKEVMSDMEDSKYQSAEFRVSIYGRKRNEWDELAKWAVKNKMYSPNIMWMIQVPRLYDIFRANNLVSNFNEIINNIFMPLFEVTNDPSSHPELHKFLAHVSGFDSVDDESKPERDSFKKTTPTPPDWTSEENPPYVYYIYYMYANLMVLNRFRRERGLNIFNFRPHCGEAGSVSHLIASYMLAENISHGLVLRKVPVLQYLFYLCQIGIAMSPLSNNSMFLNYIKNPFYDYHQIGLNVSLSTDDPLQFHFTKEPLMEEYSIATQVWKLSPVDMCELARNSVVMSGFPTWVKQHWLGASYKKEGVPGNDMKRTNVPDIRVAFRYETFVNELKLLVNAINTTNDATH